MASMGQDFTLLQLIRPALAWDGGSRTFSVVRFVIYIAMAWHVRQYECMKYVCTYFLAFLLSLASFARAGEIALLLSDDSKPYAEFAQTLSEQLDRSDWKITLGPPANNAAPVLIITAGSDAFREALKLQKSIPILATLLTRHSYNEVLAGLSQGKKNSSAIFLDQPPERQARFLRALLPEQINIGILFSSQTLDQKPEFERALISNGRNLIVESTESPEGALSALNRLLNQVDVLLALPDSKIYKRDTVKPILVTGFRYQRPIVAFSPAFVTAGAIGAIYTTPAQIASQAASIILSRGANLRGQFNPAQFSIVINPTVADSLGLSLPSESDIRRKMLPEGVPR